MRPFPRGSLALPIVALILFVVGYATRVDPATLTTPEQIQSAVVTSAIPFVAIFVGILLLYIFAIVVLAWLLNRRVPQRLYTAIEAFVIGGIVLGVIGIFNPWHVKLYEVGFYALLASTLGFIAWSHVVPARQTYAAAGPTDVQEIVT